MPLDHYSGTPRAKRGQPIIFWIVWFALLQGVILLTFFLRAHKPAVSPGEVTILILVAPMILGTLVRWLVLPRFTTQRKALPIFILGLALCEGTAILGLFLGGKNSDGAVALGLLGIAQYVPLFAAKLQAEPESASPTPRA